MSVCVLFTSDELAAFTGAGGTVNSGPHASEEVCNAACVTPAPGPSCSEATVITIDRYIDNAPLSVPTNLWSYGVLPATPVHVDVINVNLTSGNLLISKGACPTPVLVMFINAIGCHEFTPDGVSVYYVEVDTSLPGSVSFVLRDGPC